MIGGIWGGLIMASIYVFVTIKHKIPSLVGLAWPALFLSLGWNFLDFGIDPPGDSGLVWGRPFPVATSLRDWNDSMP